MTYLELARQAQRRTSVVSAPRSSMTGSQESQGWDETSLAQTVANLRRLSAAEREDYRAELAAAAPDDFWLAFDREALRRAEAVVSDEEITP